MQEVTTSKQVEVGPVSISIPSQCEYYESESAYSSIMVNLDRSDKQLTIILPESAGSITVTEGVADAYKALGVYSSETGLSAEYDYIELSSLPTKNEEPNCRILEKLKASVSSEQNSGVNPLLLVAYGSESLMEIRVVCKLYDVDKNEFKVSDLLDDPVVQHILVSIAVHI